MLSLIAKTHHNNRIPKKDAANGIVRLKNTQIGVTNGSVQAQRCADQKEAMPISHDQTLPHGGLAEYGFKTIAGVWAQLQSMGVRQQQTNDMLGPSQTEAGPTGTAVSSDNRCRTKSWWDGSWTWAPGMKMSINCQLWIGKTFQKHSWTP